MKKHVAIVVGITGKAGAGKDTVADYLVREHGFQKLSFATILKKMLDVAGMPEPANRDDKEKVIPGFTFTWREAAQRLGTEWGRGLDPNIWVDIIEKYISMTEEKRGQRPRFVLADARFENEAVLIRRRGVLLHIYGREADLGANAGHASEAGIAFAEGDERIDNSDTFEVTKGRVLEALGGVL